MDDGTFQQQTIWADNVRLHFVDEGSGPVVMLIHGFPESWYSWKNQIQPLKDAGFRVIVPDMRGYGQSSKPTEIAAYRITELVGDCVRILDAIHEPTAAIVGHDWGAPVAWTAAWTRPDRFTSVVGLSVPFGGRSLVPVAGAGSFGDERPTQVHRRIVGDSDNRFYQEYYSLPGAIAGEFEPDPRRWLASMAYTFSGAFPPADYVPLDVMTATPEQILELTRSSAACISVGARMCDAFVLPDVLPDWLADGIDDYAETFARSGIEAPLNWYRAMDLSWEDLAEYHGTPLTVPGLFIGSDLDVVTLWGAEAIAAWGDLTTSTHEVVILKDCGHWMMREKPDEVNAALLNFLDHNSPGESGNPSPLAPPTRPGPGAAQ